MIKPMLANKIKEGKMLFPCFVQPKLNGVRALYQKGTFVSRDGHAWRHGVLEHLAREVGKYVKDDTILDGELYVHGWTLQEINGAVAVNRKAPCEQTGRVEYHVFDVVGRGTFLDRYNWYMSLGFDPSEFSLVRPVSTTLVVDKSEADRMYEYYVNQHYEGTMHRDPYGPYSEGKRVNHLLKRKDWQDAWFEVCGVEVGLGKHEGRLGALVCWTGNDRHSKFNIGTGYSDIEREALWANPPIGKLCHVKYLTLSLDKVPIHPVFLELK